MNNIEKSISIIFFLLLVAIRVCPQSTIKGRVLDKQTLEPIEFVSIGVLSKDSSIVTSSYSDIEGRFQIKNALLPGDYLIACSYVGYKKNVSEIKVGQAAESLNLDDIALETSDITLESVTVTGNAVIKKVDRDIIIPSDALVKASTDGMNLLQNMHLPRLSVDILNKRLQVAGGGEAQIRINGVVADLTDVSALRPEDIVRIEYHQDPGLRYGNVAAVVDYITRRRESGGSVNANLMNNIERVESVGFRQGNVGAKFNHKKSEFSVNSNLWHRKIAWTRENIEQYKYQDEILERHEQGVPTQFKTTNTNTKLNYSLVEKDKYFFNAALRLYRDDTPNDFMNREGTITSSFKKISPLNVKDLSSSLTTRPSFDLYFQRNLKNDQLLIFNVVGTYIDSKVSRVYQESRDGKLITDVFSNILGDRYSLIGEGIYEKQFSNSKITAGIKHAQSYTKNQYEGTTVANVAMNNAETYGYAEFQAKRGKLNYALGVGVSRNYYSQAGTNKEDYTFRPTVQIGYNIKDNAYIKLRSYMSSNAPSLSDLNDVEQIIDSLQIRRGNPNLTTSWHLTSNLTTGIKFKFISFDYFLMHNYQNKPVMSETLFEEGKFIQTVRNQKNFQRIYTNLSIKVQPWQEYITLSLTPGFNYFRSHGHNYLHSHSNWFLQGGMMANYKGFMLNVDFTTNQHWLSGESLSYNENYHIISLGYKKPRWDISLGAFNPFLKSYKNDNESLSQLTPKFSHINSTDISPMFFVNINFNINFGRKFDSASKRLNHEDRDSGIMSGGK